MPRDESDGILNYLYHHMENPLFQCRFRWRPGSLAMWDNRCTQHRGINDFFPAFRLMQRIPLVDERRPSVHPENEQPLQFGDVPYVNTEDLFDTRPEMAMRAYMAMWPMTVSST